MAGIPLRALRWLCVLMPLLMGPRIVGAETLMVPVSIDGETLRLEMRIYKPAGADPFPTVIFHHGSTGRGTDPSLFTRPFDPVQVRELFLNRGWAFVLPSRRGRGGSEGVYDEGFSTPRSLGYTCTPEPSLAGADRALRDIDAATAAILAMPFVDKNRVVIAGQSRGGILSIAYAGQRPELFQGVISFVGGWLGTGCRTASLVNEKLFERGAGYGKPTLWLYGEGDPFYPLTHSRANFAAFQSAGGQGEFREYPAPEGLHGHLILAAPSLWSHDVDDYVARRGLPAQPH